MQDKTQAAVAIFNRLADVYQNKYMDQSLYHDTFDFFCKNIAAQNPNVLEIACGPGNITQYLLKVRPDLQIFGIDLAPNMIELAKQNNPTAHFEVMDAKTIGQLPQKYHAIMCGFCLPYLNKMEALQLIQDAVQILLPGGTIYLSTMENDYDKSAIQRASTGDEMFIHFHEAAYLIPALEENGFSILDVQRKVYPDGNGNETIDLVLIARLETL
jgi:2-polyprenyl-3-methyl-5-hydroxy-6-metoxy-1,4-benzoquinol methylase